MNKWIASFAIATLAGLLAVAGQNVLQQASLSLLNYLDHYRLLVMFFLGLWVFRFR